MSDPLVLAMLAAANNPYWCLIQQVTPQSISNTTSTGINFDTMLEDPSLMSTLGAGAQLTIPVSGLWIIGGSCGLTSHASMTMVLSLGGSLAQWLDSQTVAASTVQDPTVSGSTVAPLQAGATLKLNIYQNSGGAINTFTTSSATTFWAVLLRAL